jgi:hypothetical protein
LRNPHYFPEVRSTSNNFHVLATWLGN